MLLQRSFVDLRQRAEPVNAASRMPLAATSRCTSDGQWVARTTPPYKNNASFWKRIGVVQQAKRRSKKGFGYACPGHSLFDWVPSDGCGPLQSNPEVICSRMLKGAPTRQLLFVGDSTMGQLFIAFIFLLQGSFGHNSAFGHTLIDLTASACDSRVRLEFVRSDLLLWTNDLRDSAAVTTCTGYSMSSFFLRRSVLSDTVVLGVGQHFPTTIDVLHGGWNFTEHSLKHTLRSLVSLRTARGYLPSSVHLVTAVRPIPFCSRFTYPIESPAEAAAAADRASVALNLTYARRWTHLPRVNRIARRLAGAMAISLIDVSSLSAQRPDGAMAKWIPQVGLADEDCVHSCMPGPVDSYAALVLRSVVLAPYASPGACTRTLCDELHKSHRLYNPKVHPGFFTFNESEWLQPPTPEDHPAVHRKNKFECERQSPRKGCTMLSSLGVTSKQQWWWPYRITIFHLNVSKRKGNGTRAIRHQFCEATTKNGSAEEFIRLWNVSDKVVGGSSTWNRVGPGWVLSESVLDRGHQNKQNHTAPSPTPRPGPTMIST